jgi:hypothetical protein
VARTLTVTTPAGATANVTITVPAAWTATTNGYGVKDEYGETTAGVELDVTCNGDCAASALGKNLADLIGGVAANEAQPNVGTGDPTLDAVRLDVKTVDQGDLTDAGPEFAAGKFVVVRVTKPAGLDGPYPEQLVAVCGRVHPNKDRLVIAKAFVGVDQEKDLGPAIIDACKSFTIQK